MTAKKNDVSRQEVVDVNVLRSGSRLRLRALALIEGAMGATGLTKAALARRLEVRRSAVGGLLRGNGNMTLQTLAEYLGAMGYELELVPVEAGEISLSMRERRAPFVAQLTIRDCDWRGSAGVLAVGGSTFENRSAHVASSARPRSVSLSQSSDRNVSWGGELVESRRTHA